MIDLKGKQFGRFTVLSEGTKKKYTRYWHCQCSCGNTRIIPQGNLIRGLSQSCGCLRDERTRVRNSTHGHTRGYGTTLEYKSWLEMIHRCCCTTSASYGSYGGRGITVCDEWRHSFEQFLADMGPRPSREHSIDRIDNDGPYSKSNCRWATRKQQCRNRRSSRFVSYDGQSRTLAEWSEITGIKQHTLNRRLWRGWSAERTLTTPVPRKPSGS
jgi:hypothetical protein